MYDYIIVGAGSAGCVLANRLSADPNLQVCLLAAGPVDNSLSIKVPLGFPLLIVDEFHGVDGELNVADSRSMQPLGETFLQACREAGCRDTDDFNGALQEGIGYYQVTQKNGLRCSAATAFLHPVSHRKNYADTDRRQYQCTHHHDWGKGGGYDSGG